MEADWAVEIGSGLDRIDADWAGFVDLGQQPEAIETVAEAAHSAALREALLLLNSAASPVFTSKCDVWPLAADEIDPLEFDASAETALCGIASYIDVIAREPVRCASFERHEAWVREAALKLRRDGARNGRVDWVVRAATAKGREGFGITLYAAGCGADTEAAGAAWGDALRAAVAVTMRLAAAPSGE
jgi:hypothetical protein